VRLLDRRDGVDPANERDARQYWTQRTAANTRSEAPSWRQEQLHLTLMGAVLRRLQETTVQQALETIRRRVDALG